MRDPNPRAESPRATERRSDVQGQRVLAVTQSHAAAINLHRRLEARGGQGNTVDGQNSAPPKKRWNDDSPANNNKQWFQPCLARGAGFRPSTVGSTPGYWGTH